MRILCFVLIFMLFSCKKKEEPVSKINSVLSIDSVKKPLDSLSICTLDSLNMQTSEFKNIKFYTENTLRGEGVTQLDITRKVIFLNFDKTIFGSIDFKNDTYNIDFPSKVVAREILPDSEYQIFSFDSELPKTDKNYLIVYINGEKKLVDKKDLKYNFLKWNDYIKSAFIQLTNHINNVNNDELEYLYTSLEVKNDSMLIQSVPKSNCDYIEKYKNVKKWIIWRDQNCKLINFNFCY